MQNPGINTSLLVEHAYNPIHRRYQYDPAGKLVRTLDKLRGEIKYEYEANGQLHSRDTGSLVGSEEFRYDPAANRLDFNARQLEKVKDNRIKRWRDQEYRYDPWGNLIEKRSGHSKLQSFSYDCENWLVRAETLVNGKLESTGAYRYDSLGRRIAKTAEIGGTSEQKHFLWQGLRMLREETPGQSILYLYEPGSYAPLARVDQAEGEEQKIYYFHSDQIGTPLELSDSQGEIVWQATYCSWGAIEQLTINEVEQNLRFQGQYFDHETGLHYNTFRYYDPEMGRFIVQDPLGLMGGGNLYRYGPNPILWIDPLGWMPLANPVKVGHHMVPHSLATSLGITPFNSFNNVPSMFWLEPGQWNRMEHSGMHGYNGLGASTKPAVTLDAFKSEGLTNEKWLQSLEAHYNNPEISHFRGDLRLVENGNPGRIIAANVSPAEGWAATKAWARSKGASLPGCS